MIDQTPMPEYVEVQNQIFHLESTEHNLQSSHGTELTTQNENQDDTRQNWLTLFSQQASNDPAFVGISS